MKSLKILLLLILTSNLCFGQVVFFVGNDMESKKEMIVEIDSAKNNTLNFGLLCKTALVSPNKIESVITLTNLGTLDNSPIPPIVSFDELKHSFLKQNESIILSFTIAKNVKYKDIAGKSIFFKLTSTETGNSPIESYFQVRFEKKKEPVELDDFIRINLGTNFDYINPNPFRLLYADVSIFNPDAFSILLDKTKQPRKFGFYGRIFQFQGVSQVYDKERENPFFYLKNGETRSGVDTLLKILPRDSVKVARPYYSVKTGDTKVRNYGVMFGITTPIVHSEQANGSYFYMSLGLHFDGVLQQYERDNTFTKLFTDTLKLSKAEFLNRSKEGLPTVNKRLGYTANLGISLPIQWKFGYCELKIIPAVSLYTFTNNLPKELFNDSGKKIFNVYSVQAVLTEIKETGINVGCEIRGFQKNAPATFSIFLAKSFNMRKLGDFLHI